MKLFACAVCALVLLAGCGSSDGDTQYRPEDVERAFADAGIALRRLASAGAEQPAMGETSECGTRYVAAEGDALLSVSVCDDAEAARAVGGGDSLRRGNVAVEYGGDDPEVRDRVDRALDALES